MRVHDRPDTAGPVRLLTSNPRYFIDKVDRAVYLTGSHHWFNFQDGGITDPPPIFDFPKYLDFLGQHNHNFIRLWTREQARRLPSPDGADFYIDPLPYSRRGPGIALDGKPKFDLDQFNPVYFDRLHERVIAAKARGIYVSIMLFNGWSVMPFDDLGFPGNPWLGHPFHRDNNINHVDGDINNNNQGEEVHTLSADPRLLAVRARQEAYVRKVIDTINDLDNVLYEVGNELIDASTEWQYHMIRYIKGYEALKPYQHPVGMTYQGVQGSGEPTNAALFNSPADWISPGRIASTGASLNDQYQNNPPVADGRKVVLSDTDHLWGVGGDGAWVWKSFLRGLNPIYMDPYGSSGEPPADESARRAMGDTLRFATRMDLAAMLPRPELASSGYCLARPGREYLVYLPRPLRAFTSPHDEQAQTVIVDLSGSSAALYAEWFNPSTGETISAGTLSGGSQQTATAPFGGDAVLYLSSHPQ